MNRVCKKKCVQQRLVEKCNFFVATLLHGIFFGFFLVLQRPKKCPRNFFLSQNQNFRKNKNVYIYYFYQILKFNKVWIAKSQKICQIVIRKYAVFSYCLMFKETFFKFFSSFLLMYILKFIRYSVKGWGAIKKKNF